MKFQVGDIVRLVHSNEEGEVIDIINDKMVMIDVKGVKFPAYMDQIEFPYFKRFSEKKLFEKPKQKKFIDELKKEKNQPPKVADGAWLSFLPVMDLDEFGDEVVRLLKVHLVNRTENAYRFMYRLNYFGEPGFELKNEIQPFADFYIHDVPFEDMNDNPSFDFEFSLLQPDKKKATHLESQVKIRPKQLFTKLTEIRKKNEATFSYLLFERYPDRPAEESLHFDTLRAKGYKIYDVGETRKNLEPARSMIDLHIEKLSDDWKHLSNFEILTIQLQAFEKYYELAILHYLPSLIIVHGVGSGKLRDEVHDILRLKREVKSFVNQYHPLYGYGATEIFFEY